MSKRIGSTFGDELIAAGLGGLPFSWSDDGELYFNQDVTDEQKQGIEAVLAAHDPAAAEARDVLLTQLKVLVAEADEPDRRREAILGTDNGWLADTDAKIKALRAQLK